MAVFLVATILILMATAVPNIIVQGRREREAETIWRGEQYQRAIGMYFRKFGRYPTKIDDLIKQTNGIRFLRQAYTDPMNKEDGSWRFIYVGPNGQLIGSVRSISVQQSTVTNSAIPGAGAQPSSPSGVNSGSTPGAAGQSGQQTNAALAPNPLASQPQPLQGAVIGGNIIGVGSKVKKSSLRVYQGGDTYAEWEFIWNPLQMGVQQAPVNTNEPPGPNAPPGVPLPQQSNPSPSISQPRNMTNP